MPRWLFGMVLGCGVLAIGCELIGGIDDRRLGATGSESGSGGAGAGAGATGGSGAASGSGGATGSGGSTGGGGNTGPGPHGALPIGYCCASNEDCRHRNCVTIGGSQMCADLCRSEGACLGGAFAATCVGGTTFEDGRCEPVQAGAACVPADQFQRGSKKLGDCCAPTFDGTNGAECEGNHCSATGDISNPYICTQACEGPTDCPGPFLCAALSTYSVCISGVDPYTCY